MPPLRNRCVDALRAPLTTSENCTIPDTSISPVAQAQSKASPQNLPRTAEVLKPRRKSRAAKECALEDILAMAVAEWRPTAVIRIQKYSPVCQTINSNSATMSQYCARMHRTDKAQLGHLCGWEAISRAGLCGRISCLVKFFHDLSNHVCACIRPLSIPDYSRACVYHYLCACLPDRPNLNRPLDESHSPGKHTQRALQLHNVIK